jgi:Swt1-like HEPN
MAQSNLERVGRALELLNKGLKPFIEREMLAKYGARWQYEALKSLREQHFTDDDDLYLDTQGLLLIMWDQWNDVFYKVLGHAERSLVSELRDTRNKWAHQKAFSTDNLYRALDSIHLLLISISARSSDKSRKCCAYGSRNRLVRKPVRPPSLPSRVNPRQDCSPGARL